ncbi:uncharacterized protein LOC117823262 [Xyrichtys novacula]|uniref:Uncharacterized protein LOC117823262 n=1 Tax=Xyrichtys novacula TaxID=13765 RepID=A0AAV1FQ72_XYRNO|nr:uncharacterized protein LOC117823262 [Xyrichtys novacula]
MTMGKPFESDACFTERQQMSLDTESATRSRMEAQSRSSQKYLLLQVWCGLLTLALVVMAALLTSVRTKPAEANVASLESDFVMPTDDSPTTPLKLSGSSPSFIQLIKSPGSKSWQAEHRCESCSLDLRDDSIYCNQTSLYFLYAQVTFSRHPKKNVTKSVILKRNASFGLSMKILVEGTFSPKTEDSVWVAKIVSLIMGESISLYITEDFLTESTFWGAYQLH